ncbi:MAG: hypothetical protein ABL986_19985 [Vicinamibacterales bacterium]
MQIKMRQICLLAMVAVAVVALGNTVAAQVNPQAFGTWKLNLAKSKYTAGVAPKSVTFVTVAAGAGLTVTVDAVAGNGTAQHWGYTANNDGKDNPVTGNSANGDMVARTLVDASTTRMVYKKAGKVTVTQTVVLSSDGKTTTITAKGTSATGQPVDNVAVYDKQ